MKIPPELFADLSSRTSFPGSAIPSDTFCTYHRPDLVLIFSDKKFLLQIIIPDVESNVEAALSRKSVRYAFLSSFSLCPSNRLTLHVG